MNKKKKILIACDKSSAAKALYYDLKRAGLAKRMDAVILSIADVIVPPAYEFSEVPNPAAKGVYFEDLRSQIREEIKKAQDTAEKMKKYLAPKFPAWKFRIEAKGDSPAWGIIKKAEQWRADLVVAGSHGWNPLGRMIFGSVALKILSEAPCSVRIVRSLAEETGSPPRIVIGVDGSRDSRLAVDTVAGRFWKKGAAVHLVTVLDPGLSSAIFSRDPFVRTWKKKGDENPRLSIERMIHGCKKKLRTRGLSVSSLIKEGDVKRILVTEAEKWGADSIFLGARGLSKIERFLLGSVSTAVAARAHCSVEIVRSRHA